MFYQIVKTNKPRVDQIHQIRNLVDAVSAHDGYPIKVYWDVLYKRGGGYISDYFYYQDENLLAVLNLYRFKANMVEISAVTHPSVRRQGHYRYLFNEAMSELKRVNIPNISFICHQNSKSFIDYLAKKNVKFDHSEEQLLATDQFELPESLPISLRLAQKEDLEVMALIHQESFSGSIDNHRRYIASCFEERNYEMWLCMHNGQAIGKLHLYFNDFNEVLIHDLGMLKDFRRQGLGMLMLKDITRKLFERSYPKVFADIYTHDAGVVDYYKKCGFIKSNRYNFYHSLVSRWT